MNQNTHLSTSGVRDFETSKKFYEEMLRWKPTRSQEDVALFQTSGVVFATYPREKLAEDALISPEGSGLQSIFPVR